MGNNVLEHYGVLGMKWGVRRAQNGRVTLGKKSKTQKPDPLKKMTDQELRNRINRIQMERQYKQLTAPQRSAGQKIASDILVNAAKQTATSYISKAMTKGVESALKKKAGS